MKFEILTLRRLFNVIAAEAIITFMLPLAVTGQVTTSNVLIDRSDKQNITGTTEIAFAWGQQLQPPQSLRRGVINLMEAMNTWTKVETSIDNHLLLSDKRIMNYPFVFITADKRFELTQTEIDNLREYISNGGFLFVDNAQPVSEISTSGSLLKNMLEQVIPNARFESLQNSSRIYHSFFDFNDGPPIGAEIGTFPNNNIQVDITTPPQRSPFESILSPQRFFLEGVRYKGRLVAVYSDKGYIVKWAEEVDNDPQLRMGVNLIIFALTQEGSIAEQSTR